MSHMRGPEGPSTPSGPTPPQGTPRVTGRPPVDPRFRRRWAEARRQEGRRRLRLLSRSVVLVLTLGAGVALVYSPLFKVRHVVVHGAAHTPTALVLAAAGLEPGAPAKLMVDAGSPRAVRAVDALPWVSRASFARDWPWALSIDITERVPAALVPVALPAGGRGALAWELVDSTGRALQVLSRSEPRPSLPVVPGLRSAAPGQHVLPGRGISAGQLGALLQAAAAAPALLAKEGLVLSYRPNDGLTATLGPAKALILLGNSSQIAMKWEVLAELGHTVDLAGYAQVDLTVPGRPALTPAAITGGS